MTTENLNLITHNQFTNLDRSFEQYRLDLDGTTDSNMTKIDDYAGTIPVLLSLLNTSIAGSFVPFYNFCAMANETITTASADLNVIDAKFNKIATHSGSGQADFTGISPNYTHLLMIGRGSVDNTPAVFADIGIDFNGDSGSSNYATLQLDRSGSASGSYIKTFSNQQSSQIVIGRTNCNVTDGYSNVFMAIIPFYSGSASGSYLYKTAMGFSIFSNLMNYASAGIQGGVWLSGSSINRIRVFGSVDSSTKKNFFDYTTIDLYGIQ